MTAYYVQHRTAQEMSGSGHTPDDLPWKYGGPFRTFKEAKEYWDSIHPHHQEGRVVAQCDQCGSYVPAKERTR